MKEFRAVLDTNTSLIRPSFPKTWPPAARMSSRECPPLQGGPWINFAPHLLSLGAENKKKLFFISLAFPHPALCSHCRPWETTQKGFWALRNLLDSLHLRDFPDFLAISHYFLPGHVQMPLPPFCRPSFNPIQEVKVVIIYYHPLLKVLPQLFPYQSLPRQDSCRKPCLV